MATVTRAVTPYRERYSRRFPGRLGETREAAMARFVERGFPTTDEEEWRFTPLGRLTDTEFAPAGRHAMSPEDLSPWTFDDAFGTLLVVVNGRFAPELSRVGALPAGVRCGSLAEAIDAGDPATEHVAGVAHFENRPMTALNTALFEDGVLISIPRNAVVEDTIHVLHLSAGGSEACASHPRGLILAGENSQVRVVESFAGPDGAVYFTNPVTEIVLEAGAIVDQVRVQRESGHAFHIADVSARLGRASRFSSNTITLGGSLSRGDTTALLDGEGVECTVNGLYIADGARLVDNHTTIDHARAHCTSHEHYKGIIDGHGRGVFNGKILVRLDAQKTDAKQTNQTLLLSDDAQIHTKPQLEIFADDVRCTHGATVGQLDEDAMFYLRARGISREQARAMLIYAFAADIVERVQAEPVREELRALVLQRLSSPRVYAGHAVNDVAAG